ncbi:MAG: hypothetical protein R6U58_04935 [Bacteroidales bacterium]
MISVYNLKAYFIQYATITALLVEAVKEQQQQIEDQQEQIKKFQDKQNQIQAAQAENEYLKSRIEQIIQMLSTAKAE